MRLIDLDKLLLQVKMRRYTKASLSLLYNQEVVDAIPVDYINSYLITCSNDDRPAILKLIKNWRKENEQVNSKN